MELHQVLTYFANAQNPYDACKKHFTNMQALMSFDPNFSAQVEKAYLERLSLIESVANENKEFLESVWEEKSAQDRIKQQLENVNIALSEISYDAQRLHLVTFSHDGAFVEGEPDISTTYSDTAPVTIDDLKDIIGDEVGYALASDFFDRLQELMETGRKIRKSPLYRKIYFTDELYELVHFRKQIETYQENLRRLLQSISDKKNLKEIPEFTEYFLHLYNTLPIRQSLLVIGDDGHLLESPSIAESDYFWKGTNGRMNLPFKRLSLRIYEDITYCVIEFLKNAENLMLIRKCESCQRFFVASKLDNRIKKCSECSRKSNMSKDERRKYQQKWRAKKRAEKRAQEREYRIKRFIDAGFSREEAIEIIKADSEM